MIIVDSLGWKNKINILFAYIGYMGKVRHTSLSKRVYLLEMSITNYLCMYKQYTKHVYTGKSWNLKKTNIYFYFRYFVKIISLSECSINIWDSEYIRAYGQRYREANKCFYTCSTKKGRKWAVFISILINTIKNNRIQLSKFLLILTDTIKNKSN
jgi:hypothetical protein